MVEAAPLLGPKEVPGGKLLLISGSFSSQSIRLSKIDYVACNSFSLHRGLKHVSVYGIHERVHVK